MANNNEHITTDPPNRAPRPVQDEWGMFDPEQAGLAAVLRRLTTGDGDDRPEPPVQPAQHRPA